MLLQLSHFSPFIPLCPATLSHLYPPPPPYFMSMGHTYKFVGFYISYTILTLHLSILYLPFMFLIPCTFSLIPWPCPHPHPSDNPPCDVHFSDSVPVLVVCLVCVCFWFSGSGVESCLLSFSVHSFYLLLCLR